MAVKKKKRLSLLAKILIFLIIISIVGISGTITIGRFYHYEKIKEVQFTSEEVKTKPAKREYHASLVMVGDSLIHSSIYEDAKQKDGSYDFKPMIENIKPLIQNYDLKYYNQETILGGTELGLSNYPRFNSPYEVGDAFIDAGFNLVSLATNHTMDKGEIGVINSHNYWQKHSDIYTAGSYTSFEERDMPVIKEVNGIKYSFLSYTTWTNGLYPESGKEYLNNVYSNELAKADIERVRDQVDVIIVAMHWGTEYSHGVSQEQQEIANYLSSLGVNIIIGTHPHVVEPIDFINNTLVIYSLGNFISDQVGIERLTGLMASVDINKTVEDHNTQIELTNVKAELLYTDSNNYGKRNFKVIPYTQLNNTILPNYKEYYQTYKNIVLERNKNIIMPEL